MALLIWICLFLLLSSYECHTVARVLQMCCCTCGLACFWTSEEFVSVIPVSSTNFLKFACDMLISFV